MSGQRRDCACPRSHHEHGTWHAYCNDDCRCQPCRDAWAAYTRKKRRRAAWANWNGPLYVHPAGSTRRLQALAVMGWSAVDLAPLLGASKTQVENWRIGKHRWMYAATAARIAAAYDRVWDKPPPGPYPLKVKRCAARHGWLPPLAWDDDTIDDPDAQPYTDEPETAVLDEVLVDRYIDGTAPPVPHGRRAPAERREAITRLAGKGWDDGRIGRRVGLSRDAVLKERTRHGIPAGTPREAA